MTRRRRENQALIAGLLSRFETAKEIAMAAPKRRHTYCVGRRKNPTHTERDDRIWNTNYQLLNGSMTCAVQPLLHRSSKRTKKLRCTCWAKCNFSRECQGDNPSGPLSAILRELLEWKSSNLILKQLRFRTRLRLDMEKNQT